MEDGTPLTTTNIRKAGESYQARFYTKLMAKQRPSQQNLNPSKTPSLSENQQELDLFHYLFDHIDDEILLITHKGWIVFANQAALSGLKFTKKELHKKNIVEFMSKPMTSAEWRKKYFLELKARKTSQIYEIERIVKGGKKQVIRVKAVYLMFKNREYILSIAHDITEHKQFKSLLEQSKQMRSIIGFISGMAQEVKSPLQSVLKTTQGLVGNYKNRDFEYISYKEFKNIINTINTINDRIKYCCETTDRLISLQARKNKLNQKSCQLNLIVHEICQLLNQQFKLLNIKVHLQLQRRLPDIGLGPVEANQVVNNIVVNALQAMPAGGNLRIRSFFNQDKRSVELTVRDEGVGIPNENLQHIFEPFFTTKQMGVEKSAGLGLSVVYSIIKSSGGDVQIESSLRHGTTVKVLFPLVRR